MAKRKKSIVKQLYGFQIKFVILFLVLLCFCCMIFIITIYQTFASEDKGELIRGGLAIAECTGLNLSQEEILNCAVEKQIEKYSVQQSE